MTLHTVYISVGSNMGEKRANCQNGIDSLAAASPQTTVAAVSPFYKTEPMDFKDQDWFVNAMIKIKTDLDHVALLDTLQGIQKNAGRITDKIKYGPRTLDLDIIFFDDLVIDTERLKIPHPRMHERRFVLQPLCDISPKKIHPVLKKTVESLMDMLDDREGKVIPYS